jgi:phage tail sheath protein FI
MPITPTFPGIYIEELPSNAHSVTAAPTSVTVFIGYTHPFKTNPDNWNKAVEIFSYLEYEKEFGGMYTSGAIESHVAYAVNQFFLNGGSTAWVVGLRPSYFDTSTDPPTNEGFVGAAMAVVGGANGITFTAKEPIDVIPMSVTIDNLQTTTVNNDTADISISYGSRAETFRKVTTDPNSAKFIQKVFDSSSQLVAVSPTNTGTNVYGNPLVAVNQQAFGYPNPPYTVAGYPKAAWTTFNAADFAPVFQEDSSLDKVSIFNLMVIPGVADNGIWSEAAAFCERKRAFLIMDPPTLDSADGDGGLPLIADDMLGSTIPKSANSALYFPYLKSSDPLTSNIAHLPPSGFVAGIFARTDVNRGVWKAPAGLETVINNTVGVVESGRMTDARQGTLNPIGVNCIRDFPGIGSVVFGARTSVAANPSFEQWRYVPVRRMALFIEQSLYNSLGWAVFEPNDEPLWIALRTTVENFMLGLFNQGAFQGSKPSQAFQVKCDGTTTTQTDIDNGIVNIIVAFAPLKPAEFVIIKIAQLAGQTQA